MSRRLYIVGILSIALLALTTPLVVFAEGTGTTIVEWAVGSMASWIEELFIQLMSVGGFLVWIAGVLLNFTIQVTVLEMSTYFNTPALYIAWSTFRDLANILIIFALLAIGIGTILQIEEYTIKRLLPQVIVVAVLLNFSLFVGKALIDVGNVFALQFYGAITTQTETGVTDAGLSGLIVEKVNLASFYKVDPSGATVRNEAAQQGFSTVSVIMVSLLGTVVFVIIAIVLVLTSIALVIRFVTLFFLLVLSSLAFAALVLPQTRDWFWKKWLPSLIQNAVYAPLYLMLLWVSLMVIQGFDLSKGKSFAAVANANSIDSGAILLNFVMIVAFLLGALRIAQEFGAYGAESASKWVGNTLGRAAGAGTFGVAGLLARNSVGRTASRLARSETLKEWSTAGGIGGIAARVAMRGSRKVADNSFDARNLKSVKEAAKEAKIDLGSSEGGFKKRQEKKIEEHAKMAESLGIDKSVIKQREMDLENLEATYPKRRAELTKAYEEAKSAAEVAESDYNVKKASGASASILAEAEARLKKAKEASQEAANARNELENNLTKAKKSVEDAKKSNARQTRYADNVIDTPWLGVREPWTGVSNQFREEARAKIIKGKSKEQKLLEDLKNLSKDGGKEKEESKPKEGKDH